MNSVGQYIKSLLKEVGHSQSDIARAIGVPRQSLSYIISGRRELSMPLALKMESFFNLPEGQLLKMQTEEIIQKYKRGLKDELLKLLLKINAFWSYTGDFIEKIQDDELIEKTFIYLDLNGIAKLFELYPRDYIRKVWREKMAIQGDYLFDLNVMIALYYFDIERPEEYIQWVENEHIKHLSGHA